MSTNFSPSKISTSTRSPTFTAPLPSAEGSTSSGTSRINFTGGRLFFARCPFAGFVKRDSFTNSTRPICAASYPSFAAVLCCVTTQGPACSTVTGRTSPFESNSCVMPTFLPRIPATFVAISFSIPSMARGYWLVSYFARELLRSCGNGRLGRSARVSARLLMLFSERLNLHIHTRRQIEFHQRVHRLLRRLENVEQPLVRPNLKLLPRLLVHVRRTQHAVLVLHRGQRNRPSNLCPGTSSGFHNLARRLVKDAVVVRLQPDANSFFSNHSFISLTPPGISGRKELAASRKPRLLNAEGRMQNAEACSVFTSAFFLLTSALL